MTFDSVGNGTKIPIDFQSIIFQSGFGIPPTSIYLILFAYSLRYLVEHGRWNPALDKLGLSQSVGIPSRHGNMGLLEEHAIGYGNIIIHHDTSSIMFRHFPISFP